MDNGFHRLGRRFCLGLLVAAGFTVLGPVGVAGAAVTGTTDANTVANSIGSGTSGSFVGPVGPTQAGTGDSSLAGFPTAPPTFGVLTSGDAELADDPNDSGSDGEFIGNQNASRGNAFDPITLNMGINAPAGNTCLVLDFKFLSEEFPEFVNSGFNDAFIAELDKTTWNLSPDPKTGEQKLNAPDDFAAGYGDQVSVDTVGPTLVSAADSAGTTYDAATQVLTTKTPVAPGAHSLYLSVFDAGDGIFDSAVFVDNLRFNSEPPSTCKPPDIFGGAVGAQTTDKRIDFAGSNGTLGITCLLPPEATDPCIGKIAIFATGGGAGKAALRAKKTKVAKGKYSVEPATTGEAKVKLTKKGKRLLKKKGKSKGQAKLTNTVNGASDTFKLKLKK